MEGIDGALYIEQLTIDQKMNDHAMVNLTVVMDEDKVQGFLTANLCNRKFVLRDRHHEHRVLFNGIIKNSEVEQINGVYTAKIEGTSHTYNLDIERLQRSFQNENVTYKELFERVLQGYAHSDFICSDTLRKEPIKRFILQYDETDWEFIKRVVSRANKGLIADVQQEGAKFYIGLPEGQEEIEIPKAAYRVSRDLARMQRVIRNCTIAQIDEQDSLQYELKDLFSNYELGARVRFRERTLYVVEKYSYLSKRDGILRHHYTLRTLRGSQQEKLVNERLRGNSIAGTVIDVKSHFTKLHLHIDKEQDTAAAVWFPQPTYFTGGEGKGYGTMPERGEVLYLHFPMNYEEANYVISSDGNDYDAISSRIQVSAVNPEPSKPGKKAQANAGMASMTSAPTKTRNPGKAMTEETITRSKQWFSPGNKSLLLDDHQVKLHATGGAAQISLLEGSGILVTGKGNLDLTAKNIRINPDFVGAEETIPSEGVNVNLSAGKTVALLCEGSTLMMSEADQSIDIVSDKITLESPENPKDIQVMSQDAVAALLAEYEETRLRTQPVFKSDGTRITANDKDLLLNYFMKYVLDQDLPVSPTTKEAIEINKQYEKWRQANYGMDRQEKNREYNKKSVDFVIKGNYAEEATGLGIGANVLLGLTGLDLPADLRDLYHNFTHWEWSWGHGGETLLNSISLIPLVGALKNLKYSDEVLELAQQASNFDDLVKGINKIGGIVDAAGNPVIIKKLSDGTYELINANGKVINKIDDMPGLLDKMGVKIGKGPEVPKFNEPIKIKTNKGMEVEFTNPSSNTIKWVEQNPKNIPNAIESAENSSNAGKAVEGKVGKFVQQKTEVTGFGVEVKNLTLDKRATDVDIATNTQIIEVKKSVGAVKIDQIDRLTNPNNIDFFNYESKEVILYIDEPLKTLNKFDLEKIEYAKSQGVTIVNSLEELGSVLK
ncbi:hypothetical protein [Paenibacillus lautus]|uniref:hypothetical protein n=1 Tax=Paenibacillus lautus TaxID=1401 RepID=UPI003D2D47C4